MADLSYKFTGVNTAQLANEVQLLRQNSSTFRALEAAAAARGYKTIEIQMGAGLLKNNIADSQKTGSSTRTIRINSDATGSWGVDGRQATVGEVIVHELAHAGAPRAANEHENHSIRSAAQSQARTYAFAADRVSPRCHDHANTAPCEYLPSFDLPGPDLKNG
jgi:hypothetical protein